MIFFKVLESFQGSQDLRSQYPREEDSTQKTFSMTFPLKHLMFNSEKREAKQNYYHSYRAR